MAPASVSITGNSKSIKFPCDHSSSSLFSTSYRGPSGELDAELHDHNGSLSVVPHRPLDRPEEVPSNKHFPGPLRPQELAMGEDAVFGDELHLL